jgi:hypothetical protein
MRKILAFVLMAVVFAVSGCSGDGGSPEPSVAEESAAKDGSTALSNVEAADERAAEWNEDAELYSIASATPELGAEGNSPGWLYTYVSGSAGSVATVSVEDGTVAMDPEQELPEADINFLGENALPEAGELLDSSEAIEETEEVRTILEEEPASETAAGLDSVSGGEPVWRFSTIRGEERVEETVPAVEGGS